MIHYAPRRKDKWIGTDSEEKEGAGYVIMTEGKQKKEGSDDECKKQDKKGGRRGED